MGLLIIITVGAAVYCAVALGVRKSLHTQAKVTESILDVFKK